MYNKRILDNVSFTDGWDVTFLPIAMPWVKKAVGPNTNTTYQLYRQIRTSSNLFGTCTDCCKELVFFLMSFQNFHYFRWLSPIQMNLPRALIDCKQTAHLLLRASWHHHFLQEGQQHQMVPRIEVHTHAPSLLLITIQCLTHVGTSRHTCYY